MGCKNATITHKQMHFYHLLSLANMDPKGYKNRLLISFFRPWGIDVKGSSLKVHHLPRKQNMNN